MSSDWIPWKGERLGAAWSAALDILIDGAWHDYAEVRRIMAKHGNVLPGTSKTILFEAKKAKVVMIKGSYDMKTRRDHRKIGITRLAWSELSDVQREWLTKPKPAHGASGDPTSGGEAARSEPPA